MRLFSFRSVAWAIVLLVSAYAVYYAYVKTYQEPAPLLQESLSSASTTTSDAAPVESEEPTVQIAGATIRVRLADTPSERTQGLSGTKLLDEDEGMLFIFEEEGIHGFWMKDMAYSIDIVWFTRAGEVVHIEKNVSPESYPTSFSSAEPAQYVLETRAGFVESHNIAIGQIASFPR